MVSVRNKHEIEVRGLREEETCKVETILNMLEDAYNGMDNKPFYFSFKQLRKVIVFLSYGELQDYLVSKGFYVPSQETLKNVNGYYNAEQKEIHLLKYNQKRPNPIEFDMVLIHELSHYIMDINDVCSLRRYNFDVIYGAYEEIRVNNMSSFLAKKIMDKSKFPFIETYRRDYNNGYRAKIRDITRLWPQGLVKYSEGGGAKHMSLYRLEGLSEPKVREKLYVDLDITLDW